MASVSYTPLNHPFSTSTALDQSEIPATAKPPTPDPQSHLQDGSFSKEDRIKCTSHMPEQNRFMAIVRFIWRTLFLPVLAVAYLAFCYMCHFKHVRINIESISDPLNHLNLLKSGVTSISILYVALSLLPIYSLVSDLKSEEFFRTLSGKRSGTPLSSINAISIPSYGIRDILTTLFRRDASGYFATALIASLVALATSTLAPAALSVDTVLSDGDIIALSVGAITRNSVLDTSNLTQPQIIGPADEANTLSPQSGAVAWAEFSLHTNVSFQTPMRNQTSYIIPTPLKLSPNVRGRWISDVAVLNPTCEWIAPQGQATGVNFSSIVSTNIKMNLTSKGLGITVDSSQLSPFGPNMGMKSLGGGWFQSLGTGLVNDSLRIFDMSTMDDLTNGAAAWLLFRCTTGCALPSQGGVNLAFGSDVNFTRLVDVSGNSFDVVVLYCSPNAQIETHHISNDGQGILTVGDKVSIPQSNLHPAQTNLMMSFAFSGFDTAGPGLPFNVSSLGNQAQFNFVFGTPKLIPAEVSPIPIDQISTSYGQLLTSAAKPFINGDLATAFVPARIITTIPVFAASLSHVIASTVLYALLAAFALGCYFRRPVPPFTFVSIAASLAKSDIPPLLAQLKESEHSPHLDDGAITAFSSARVLLEDGQVLRLRV